MNGVLDWWDKLGEISNFMVWISFCLVVFFITLVVVSIVVG